MKVRWTNGSLRLRITPGEMAEISAGRSVAETMAIEGEKVWTVEIRPVKVDTSIGYAGKSVTIRLAEDDVTKLSESHSEGVYFRTASPNEFRYFVEKDYPCAHPRPADAAEPATHTFDPPPGFNDRKKPNGT